MAEPIGALTAAICIDRSGGATPVYAQIAAAVARLVAAGSLPPGVRLPAERELAAALAVNRATVGRAYRDLENRGMVSSRVGSGTVVTAAAGAAEVAAPRREASRLSRGIRDLHDATSPASPPDAEAVDFALMLPDVAMFPGGKLAAAVASALARGAEVLQYGSPAGLPALRRAIAARLARSGIAASADDVLVVNGIQQALDLLAKVLLDPGDAVAVESPTYANVLPLLKLYGARTVTVAMDEDGMDVAALERALATHHPKWLYTIPSFHNPTGATLPLARRHAVLEAARRHGTLVVEDGYEEDLRYSGEPLPPLAAVDGGGTVVYLGTFSKGLFPGLRLGYVVARGELMTMLTLAKRFTDYHADALAQAVLAEILERGDYDRHLERLRRTYRERMERTVAAMRRHFPVSVRVRSPEGGYTTWIDLPRGLRASRVAEAARRRGVAVLAGGPFFAVASDGERGLRISISRTDPRRIEAGIAVLGEVLAEELDAAANGGHADESPALV